MHRQLAVAAALTLSLGALPLLAQDPGPRFGQAGPPGAGPGGRGPGGPMGLMPGLVRLDLTDAQREQIHGIVEEERQSGAAGERVRQAEQALHAAILADSPSGPAIGAAKAALASAQAAELDRRVELMLRIGQILTPAQRRELLRLPPPGRGRWGGP